MLEEGPVGAKQVGNGDDADDPEARVEHVHPRGVVDGEQFDDRIERRVDRDGRRERVDRAPTGVRGWAFETSLRCRVLI